MKKLLATILLIPSMAMADVRVIDGDTVEMHDVKLRLAGIDCPEKRQPWGDRATGALKLLLSGADISYTSKGKDRYGRVIAVLYADRVNVNRELVKQGHCWVYWQYAEDAALYDLHDKAKAAGIGLWGLPDSQIVEPSAWRRKK